MAGLVPFNRRNQNVLSNGFDSFQNVLDDFFAEGWPFQRSLRADTFKLDIQDQKTEYMIEAELPGVKKEDIGLTLNDGRLNISIKKTEENKDEGKNYIHRERRNAQMSRTIVLADAEPGEIKAKLDNGVLSILVPKKKNIDKSFSIDIE